MAFKSPSGANVQSLIEGEQARLARPGLTGQQLKSELLAKSLEQLVQTFKQHPPADTYVVNAFNKLIELPIEEQAVELAVLREKLRYDTKKASDKNPKYDAICKRLYLMEWDPAVWNQPEVVGKLAQLSAAYSLYTQHRSSEDWKSFGLQLEQLRDSQPTSEFAESLARGFEYPNAILSAPLAPLQSVANKTINRPINETMNQGKVQLHAQGSANVNYDAHFVDINGVGNLRIDVAGVANNAVHVNRKRISLMAGLNTNVAGQVYLPMTLSPRETANFNIDSALSVQSADWNIRLPILSRLGGALILRIAKNRSPDIETLTEREIEKFMKTTISQKVVEGISQAHQLMTKYAEQNLVDNGLRIEYLGTKVNEAANIELFMDTNYGAPRLSSYTFAQPQLQDTLVIRVSEGLMTQFSDSMRGMVIRETDVRELCFEPLGLVPELQSPLVAQVPCSLHLGNSTPFVLSLNDGMVQMKFNCNAFEVDGETYTGKFILSAEYRAEYPNNSLRLVRVGPTHIEAIQPVQLDKLQPVADRFFPPAGNSSEVRLLDQLTEGTGATIEQFEIQEGWLAVYVKYDPNALLEKVSK